LITSTTDYALYLSFGGSIYFQETSTIKTHPSREKYYYMEGIDGVKLPGRESRKPYNWTAEDLMSDLEEFLGDAGTPF